MSIQFKHYEANVNGYIWDGSKASTTYQFDHVPHPDEIANKGDFERVTSYTVVRVVTEREQVKSWRRKAEVQS